ncbi:hypothetical protein HB952_11425 [Listeria welshimeri]|uniref:toxin Cry1Ac domain D-VI-related protein n=1 Tax=Listeria welshimeri TaxID=1643 RepID=UPI001626F00B|nr:toxin Cry1Ac domain D-VI-related protein [Listeria welshimeri]MBC1628470.1 hypothetical protein [Listeria welshimeri]MBF2598350.1 hypothetical protein [Listeria welshimeri]
MDKKRKIIVGVSIAVGLVILGGGALGFHNYNVKAEEKAMTVKQNKNKVKALQEEVNKFYTNPKKEDIVEDAKKDDVKELLEKALKLPKDLDNAKELQTLTTDINDLRKMVYARDKVMSLLDDQKALVSGANIQLAQEDIDRLKTIKPIFVEEQQKVIDEANNQKKVIDEATTKVNNLFTTEQKTEVKKEVTRDTYNVAKEAVNKIKQKQAKEELLKNLDTVNKSLTEKEKKEKQAAAEKAVQNETSKPAESTKSADSNSSSNESNSSSNKSSNNNSGGDRSSGSSTPKNPVTDGKQSSGDNGNTKSSGGNKSTNKSSGGSGTTKSSGGSNKSSGGNSSKQSGGNSGNKSNNNGGDKSNYDYDKKSDTEKNVNGGTNDYWGW